ncbi:MAG: hypothetical protein JNG84_10300 [Archangium sp.]|nr:hypothetical protein [Archangium sp.]
MMRGNTSGSRWGWVVGAWLALAAPAVSAGGPEDEWAPPPASLSPSPPTRSDTKALSEDDADLQSAPPRPAPLAVPPLPSAPAPNPIERRAPLSTLDRRPIVGEPNTVSMFGAPALGSGKRGQSLAIGFPLVSLRFSLGVLRALDLGLGFDSFYGSMNEVRATAKYQLAASDRWTLAASLEGGWAFFVTRARQELNGARWLTGRRNGNLTPGLVASYQGPHPKAARVFVEARYLVAFDSEPYSVSPLDGVPRGVVVGHNALLRVGAELPLTPTASFVFLVGLDVHGRIEDAPIMPACSVGVVTGL